MNLERRLRRLTAGARGEAAASSSGVLLEASLAPGAPMSDGVSLDTVPASSVVPSSAPPAPVPSEKQRTLDELRRQMHALLARDARPLPARPAPAAPARRIEDLPFLARTTPQGTLWQRVERLSPAHRVGRVAIEAVGGADPAVLAELALDPKVAESSPDSWLFIDTETTGLGGAGVLVFLVGLAALEPSGAVVVEQLLLAQPGDELALLERLGERVRRASLLVSFNGKAFDRPMLDGRLVLNRLPVLPERPHLDLLHVGRRLHRHRLGRCSLKRVESEVLGFERGHDIDGSEVGPIYSHFLRSADAGGLAAVIDHNYRDVVSMVALVALYGQRMPALVAEDMAGLARTLQRAGAMRHAERAAEAACEQGGGVEAYRVRAQLAKSRGDSRSAVRDFERLCREADDPSSRLELAKLYEHQLRQPACALRWLELGTSENFSAHARRVQRLERKLRRAAPHEGSAPGGWLGGRRPTTGKRSE
jgi:uncharacterized protein YprB with RNaseH-like and TPR domain